jgi:hypothetical protein
MKKQLCLWLALAGCSLPAAATDVGVSIDIAQPGFYGRIDIGRVAAPPLLVYPQPVLIAPPPRAVVVPQPIYLRVPPGHAQNWSKHCARYEACGRPVYFVQEDWYQRYYADPPRRQGDDDHGKGRGRGHDKHG